MSVQSHTEALPVLQAESLQETTLPITPRILVDRVHLLLERGQNKKVQQLLEDGAFFQSDADGRNALHYAALDGDLNLVSFLIDNAGLAADTSDNMGFTALHRAATHGHRDVIAALVQRGACVNRNDKQHGFSALHEAAFHGFSESVSLLLSKGSNVCAVTNTGFTALHFAAQNGHNKTARLLLLAGCKGDQKNTHGDTALHTAARYGHAGVARILISARCHVNETNKNGDTALHIAAALKRRKIVALLVEASAMLNVRNRQQEMPIDIATRKGYTEIRDLLNKPALHSNLPASTLQSQSSSTECESDFQKANSHCQTGLATKTLDCVDKPLPPTVAIDRQDEADGALNEAHFTAACAVYPAPAIDPPIDSGKTKATARKRAAQFFSRLFKRKSKKLQGENENENENKVKSNLNPAKVASKQQISGDYGNRVLPCAAAPVPCSGYPPVFYGYDYGMLPPALKVHAMPLAGSGAGAGPGAFIGASAPPPACWLYPAAAMQSISRPSYVCLNDYSYAEYHGMPTCEVPYAPFGQVEQNRAQQPVLNARSTNVFNQDQPQRCTNVQFNPIGQRLYRARSDESLSVSENKQMTNAEKAHRIAMHESQRMQLLKFNKNVPHQTLNANSALPRRFSLLRDPYSYNQPSSTSTKILKGMVERNYGQVDGVSAPANNAARPRTSMMPVDNVAGRSKRNRFPAISECKGGKTPRGVMLDDRMSMDDDDDDVSMSVSVSSSLSCERF